MSKWLLPWSGRGINYTEHEIKAVTVAMLTADPLTQGMHQENFETVFSEYHKLRHCFAVNSCASALELAATMCNLKPGDEVIIPAHTYCATAIPFARRKAKIVWADIDPRYLVTTAKEIEPLITEKTKVVVLVHLYGLQTPMTEILQLKEKYGFKIVEDCAQSLGASYKGHKSGWHGDFSCWSFHGQKNISTLGEGGMIAVKSAEHAAHVPGLRDNGHRGYPANKLVDFDYEGVYPFNYCIGDIQCAVGVQLMRRLDDLTRRRRGHANYIKNSLLDYPLTFQEMPEGSTHAHHLLVARYHKRDMLMKAMHDQGVETVIQYIPLYKMPLLKYYRSHNCTNLEEFHGNALSFPFYEWYDDYHLNLLIKAIKKGITLCERD